MPGRKKAGSGAFLRMYREKNNRSRKIYYHKAYYSLRKP